MIAKSEITCDDDLIAQMVHDRPIVWYIGCTSRRKSIFYPSRAATENFGFSSPRVICQCRKGSQLSRQTIGLFAGSTNRRTSIAGTLSLH